MLKSSTHGSDPLGRFACVYVFTFTCLLFSWQFGYVWPKGLSISLTLPSKGWAGEGSARRKLLISAFRSHFTPSVTVSCECLELSMIQTSCGAAHLFERTSCVVLIPREVIDSSPSVSCLLVLQGWFHLRSSCLCCSLITLNFLEGEQHVLSWGLILVCTVWKFPVFFVIYEMFLFVGESDLSSILVWLPLRCHSQIKVSSRENGSLCHQFPPLCSLHVGFPPSVTEICNELLIWALRTVVYVFVFILSS